MQCFFLCVCFFKEIPNYLNLGKRQDLNFHYENTTSHLWQLEHKTTRLKFLDFESWSPISVLISWPYCIHFLILFYSPTSVNQCYLFFLSRGILYLLWHGVSLVMFPGYSEGHEQSQNRKDTILIHVPIRLSAPRLCFLSSCCLLLLPSCICSQTP